MNYTLDAQPLQQLILLAYLPESLDPSEQFFKLTKAEVYSYV